MWVLTVCVYFRFAIVIRRACAIFVDPFCRRGRENDCLTNYANDGTRDLSASPTLGQRSVELFARVRFESDHRMTHFKFKSARVILYFLFSKYPSPKLLINLKKYTVLKCEARDKFLKINCEN